MDVVVVGRRAEDRWALAAVLEQPPGNALVPDAALARLSHPATQRPDAVVLVVRDETDLAWCAAQTRRSIRRDLPVLAVAVRASLVPAVEVAGARAVVIADPVRAGTATLWDCLADITAPAVVVDLDPVGRSA